MYFKFHKTGDLINNQSSLIRLIIINYATISINRYPDCGQRFRAMCNLRTHIKRFKHDMKAKVPKARGGPNVPRELAMSKTNLREQEDTVAEPEQVSNVNLRWVSMVAFTFLYLNLINPCIDEKSIHFPRYLGIFITE